MATRSSSHGPAQPDGYVVDADRGTSTPGAKTAQVMDPDAYAERTATRTGLRGLDQMTEKLPGLNRLQKDRERLFPRQTTAELGHTRMARQLPATGAVRKPLSARQRDARSKARRQVMRQMPATQLREQYELVSRPDRWQRLNDSLSESAGDVQELPDNVQERIRRADRAIQSYERANDRGHVVYSNVQMPWYINQQNVEGFVRNNFEPGRRLSFDRYTAATHQMHETTAHAPDERGRMVVFEMETRRGAYLGRSRKTDDTGHLLPRGMDFEVVSTHTATYQRPDGTSGRRQVVQLRDVTPQD